MTDANLAVLAPLMKLIEDTVRSTPIRLGPGGTDDLSAKLTVRTAAWVGKNVLPRTAGLAAFVVDVDTERQRQLAQDPVQSRPNGTSGHNFRREADTARRSLESATGRDADTWFHILRARFWKAAAETDPVSLRAALIGVADVCAAWTADLDRRIAASAPDGLDPQCPAALMPLNSDPVEPCVTRGKHSVHTTAAGQRWTDPDGAEL